jgi:hypothetical protein
MVETFNIGPGWSIGPGWNTANMNAGDSRRARSRRKKRDKLLKEKRMLQQPSLSSSGTGKPEQASYPAGSTNEILQKTEELITIKKRREKK